ncbi:NAD+ kinase [Gammaproteobacteria bacterium]
MERLSENKLVLVTRKTRLDELVARFNTIAQTRFYIEHLGADFSDYVHEHETYHQALTEARTTLSCFGRVQVLDRGLLSNFLFGRDDVVIAVGQDGLVANTLKYLSQQVLIGVNPDPRRWDGILLPFQAKDLGLVVAEVFKRKRPVKEVTLAQVTLNDGQKLLAVNDFFIGQKTHVSARYTLHVDARKERQSSSGIIISTGLGSTGWMKSVLAGASRLITQVSDGGIIYSSTGKMPWNADYLVFSVREPFPSKTSAADLVFGQITEQKPLWVLSEMAENGVIFSDGIESDYLSFNSGIEATIVPADHKGQLIV